MSPTAPPTTGARRRWGGAVAVTALVSLLLTGAVDSTRRAAAPGESQAVQSLVTDLAPSERQFRSATGYGCPDTANCDSGSYGFAAQIYGAAWQFQRYRSPGSSFDWYPVGETNDIRYSPDAECGTAPVTIANAATAGLYYYTPYQPNAAALAHLYGEGDACSAYGNRNFWQIFSTWFGDPQG